MSEFLTRKEVTVYKEPCPACGKTGCVNHTWSINVNLRTKMRTRKYLIVCDKCGAFVSDDTVQKAVDAWKNKGAKNEII